MRKEHDFLGELEVADELYYGVQTIRALENFHITGKHLDQDFIKALAMVKKASALANMKQVASMYLLVKPLFKPQMKSSPANLQINFQSTQFKVVQVLL